MSVFVEVIVKCQVQQCGKEATARVALAEAEHRYVTDRINQTPPKGFKDSTICLECHGTL